MIPDLAARCDPRFTPLLARFGLEDVERHPGTVYGLWPDFTLAYYNRAWFEFAAQNGGAPAIGSHWTIGQSVLRAVPECLRNWYLEFHSAALLARTNLPPQHEYDCSSADAHRRFLMMAYPLRDSTHTGLLLVHSLLLQTPREITDPPPRADAAAYMDEAGLIHQCAHCRRSRARADADTWHWIPEWVRRPLPNVSHALCPLCFNYYYPDPKLARDS